MPLELPRQPPAFRLASPFGIGSRGSARADPEFAAGLGVPDEMLRVPIDPQTDGLSKGLELWREVKKNAA